MTDQQLTCEHLWRLSFGGYCLDCFVRKHEWDAYIRPARITHIHVRPENLHLSHKAPERYYEDWEYIALSERELGLPDSYKGYVSEVHMIPDVP